MAFEHKTRRAVTWPRSGGDDNNLDPASHEAPPVRRTRPIDIRTGRPVDSGSSVSSQSSASAGSKSNRASLSVNDGQAKNPAPRYVVRQSTPKSRTPARELPRTKASRSRSPADGKSTSRLESHARGGSAARPSSACRSEEGGPVPPPVLYPQSILRGTIEGALEITPGFVGNVTLYQWLEKLFRILFDETPIKQTGIHIYSQNPTKLPENELPKGMIVAVSCDSEGNALVIFVRNKKNGLHSGYGFAMNRFPKLVFRSIRTFTNFDPSSKDEKKPGHRAERFQDQEGFLSDYMDGKAKIDLAVHLIKKLRVIHAKNLGTYPEGDILFSSHTEGDRSMTCVNSILNRSVTFNNLLIKVYLQKYDPYFNFVKHALAESEDEAVRSPIASSNVEPTSSALSSTSLLRSSSPSRAQPEPGTPASEDETLSTLRRRHADYGPAPHPPSQRTQATSYRPSTFYRELYYTRYSRA